MVQLFYIFHVKSFLIDYTIWVFIVEIRTLTNNCIYLHTITMADSFSIWYLYHISLILIQMNNDLNNSNNDWNFHSSKLNLNMYCFSRMNTFVRTYCLYLIRIFVAVHCHNFPWLIMPLQQLIYTYWHFGMKENAYFF